MNATRIIRLLTSSFPGNADGAIYDERDLLFQSIRGVNTATRPSAGLYAPTDPTTFNRPGNGPGLNITAPSIVTANYDRNGNPIEAVDAEPNGGIRSQIAGVGDLTATAYDGFDRPKTVTDPLGDTTTTVYDPASNVVRVIQTGDPVNSVPGSTNLKTLAVTETVPDELSRTMATHQVLFQTPYPTGGGPSRTSTLTVSPVLAAYAPYLADAATNTAAVPGVSDITVLGRLTTLTEYDRDSRPTFSIAPNLGVTRTAYDGVSRVVATTDSALSTGYGAAFAGTATAGDATTLTTSATWMTNQWQGLVVQLTGGTGAGQFRRIIGNTANVLTVSPAWTTPPAAGSTFAILNFNPTNLAGNTVQTAYDGDSNPIETQETDVTLVPGVAPENFVTTAFYDSLNRLQTQVDNLGQASDAAYDSRGNLVATADANGPTSGTSARTFNRRGPGTGSVNANGYVTLHSYYLGI